MDTNRLLIRINRIPIRISRPLIAIHSQLKEINSHRIQINRTLIGLISWLASNPPLRRRKPSTCRTQTIAMSGVFFVSKPPISPRITTRQNYRMFYWFCVSATLRRLHGIIVEISWKLIQPQAALPAQQTLNQPHFASHFRGSTFDIFDRFWVCFLFICRRLVSISCPLIFISC